VYRYLGDREAAPSIQRSPTVSPKIYLFGGLGKKPPFEDENGLYAFQTDTYHLEIAQEIRNRASTVKVMDFVVGERSEGGI
jgi:hypothetical protein